MSATGKIIRGLTEFIVFCGECINDYSSKHGEEIDFVEAIVNRGWGFVENGLWICPVCKKEQDNE